MNKKRCNWVIEGDELYEKYHDNEWGVEVHEDQKHFELLSLEGAQAGLSWITILRKRENYRKAFANFDPKEVANFSENTISDLMRNEGLVRHEKKLRSCVNNAKCFLKIQEKFGSFDKYVWKFVENRPIFNTWESKAQIPAETNESKLLSNDLKRNGFFFVGSKTIYAYMQAAGLVIDHTKDCFCYKK